jgi:hypothetical protein
MSRKESVHALFNQLTVVLGRAELLSTQTEEPKSLEAANSIKDAALRMHNLVIGLSDEAS